MNTFERSCLAILSLLFFSFSLHANGIPVREIRTTLFEKPVTGYQISLGLKSQAVQQGIYHYLKEYDAQPARFEGTLIYENLSYPAITTVRPITLYYLIEEVEGVLSELTLIGLYDYNRSIEVSIFPDLTLRMLLDLSTMIKGLTGQDLAYDNLFERMSLSEVQKRYQDRKEQNYMDFFLERKTDWIGNSGETRMKKNPFGDNRPENFDTEDKIVAALNTRFSQYVSQERSEQSPFMNDTEINRLSVYEDSIQSLLDELAYLRSGESEPWRDTIVKVERDTMVLFLPPPEIELARIANQDSLLAEMAGMEARLKQLEAQSRNFADKAASSGLDRKERVRLQNRMKEKDQALLEMEKNLSHTQEELKSAELALKKLGLKYQKSRALSDSLLSSSTNLAHERDQLAGDHQRRAQLFLQASSKVDSLQKHVQQLEVQNQRIKVERDSLITEIVMLNPDSESAQQRREVYNRQLDKLVTEQASQSKKMQDVIRREKQVAQRERYLAEYEATGESRILLNRVIQLENQVQALQADLDREKTDTETIFKDLPIQPAFWNDEVPAFQFVRSEPDFYIDEQILAWFRLRGIKPISRSPLKFEGALMPQISDELLQVQFIPESAGQWLCVFRTASGLYIPYSEEVAQGVEQMVDNMFP